MIRPVASLYVSDIYGLYASVYGDLFRQSERDIPKI